LHRILENESVQVIVLVCGPLLLLLVGLLMLLIRGSKRAAQFPKFFLAVSKMSHDLAYVIYCDGIRKREFEARIGRSSNFFVPMIHVRIPGDMAGEGVREIVPNLALGLRELRYRYLIYRYKSSEQTPAKQRNAAVAELARLGFEIEGLGAHKQGQRRLTRKHEPFRRRKRRTTSAELLKLVAIAEGAREVVEILASSETRR